MNYVFNTIYTFRQVWNMDIIICIFRAIVLMAEEDFSNAFFTLDYFIKNKALNF